MSLTLLQNSIVIYSLNALICIILVGEAANGLLAQLDGQTLRTVNFPNQAEWSDYCLYSNVLSTRTISVICRSLGYEGYQSYTGRILSTQFNDFMHIIKV